MKTAFKLLLVSTTLLLAACSSNKETAEVPQKGNSFNISHRNQDANSPVAAACSLAGGSLQLSRQLDGSSVGMCQMANGRRCMQGALLSGAGS